MFTISLYSFLDKRHGPSLERKIAMHSKMLCANFEKTSCCGSGESIISIAFVENVALPSFEQNISFVKGRFVARSVCCRENHEYL